MQKQDVSELFLSKSDRHQTGCTTVNKTIQMCRGLFLPPDILQTGLGVWQEILPSVTHCHEEVCGLQRDNLQQETYGVPH